MQTKAEIVNTSAGSRIGDPYVFGAWGEECTPANRRKRIRSGYPSIVSKCPVLSDTAGTKTCDGCPYQGRHIYDCRGFTHRCLLDAGIDISGEGATSQFDTKSNWMERGTTENMPNCVCCIFKDDGTGTKKHTGLHLGDGRIIHCSGEVKEGTIDKSWTHYAVPVGLYDAVPKERWAVMSVLKRGSKGENVVALQTSLALLGFSCGEVDGKFGANTESAVRSFQAKYGLTVDGVVGGQTWAALEKALGHDTNNQDTADDQLDAMAIAKSDWNAIRAAFAVAHQVIKKYESEG